MCVKPTGLKLNGRYKTGEQLGRVVPVDVIRRRLVQAKVTHFDRAGSGADYLAEGSIGIDSAAPVLSAAMHGVSATLQRCNVFWDM